MIEHSYEWNRDRKGGRNICYKPSQQNHAHDHQCKEIRKKFVKICNIYHFRHLWSKARTLETKTLCNPMKNLSHQTDLLCALSPVLRTVVFYSLENTGRWTKSKIPVILKDT
jgi:hypothetical protein